MDPTTPTFSKLLPDNALPYTKAQNATAYAVPSQFLARIASQEMSFTGTDATMPPRIKAPANLPELVRTAFNKARASGDVNFYPTQVTLVDVNSIPVSGYFCLIPGPEAPGFVQTVQTQS